MNDNKIIDLLIDNDNKITVIDEDDSDAWAYHLEMERCQQEEKPEAHMDTREILERLQKAGAILDVCDARLEHLTFLINETIERIEKSDLKFRQSLGKKAKNLK